MIPELGQFALVLAALVALAQSMVPLIGAARGRSSGSGFLWPISLAPVPPMRNTDLPAFGPSTIFVVVLSLIGRL